MNQEPTSQQIEQQIESQPKRLGTFGCLAIGGGILIVLLMIGGGAFYIWRSQGAKEVEERLAELREQGEPVVASDIENLYKIPDGQTDATSIWMDVINQAKTTTFRDDSKAVPILGSEAEEVPPLDQPWPEQKIAEDFLEKYKDALSKLHKAADMRGSARYETNFADGFAMKLEHAMHARTAARMLQLEAQVKARQGDAAGVMNSIRALKEVGASLQHEPTLVSQLVYIAIDAMAIDTYEKTAPHIDFSDEDLRDLFQRCGELSFAEDFRQALKGERAMGIHAFQNPGSLGGQTGNSAISFFFHTDLIFYLDTFEKVLAASKKPTPQALQEMKVIDQNVEDTVKSNGGRYPFTAMLLPSGLGAFNAVARAEASNELTRVAIAMEFYRRKHGELPDTLDKLVPEFLPRLPVDPYDGAPLRYLKHDALIKIYSVGRNLKDDGGNKKEMQDVVTTVLRKR